MAPDEGSQAELKGSRTHARRRAEGLRLVQRWVPDTRSPEFLTELRAQSVALARASADDEIMDWIEANADLDDWK